MEKLKKISFAGVFLDKHLADENGMIYCKTHDFKFKAIETNNKCLRFYKNCPYCEAETNYRIKLKNFYDALDWNNYAMNKGLDLVETPMKPDMPDWWLEASKNGFYPKRFKSIYDFKNSDLVKSIDTLLKDFDNGIDYPF